MKITTLYSIEGAKNARGFAVVIDVFRAFTTACYVFANGAQKIIPVGDIDTAYRLKKENPDFILIGEQKGAVPSDFDYGNPPSEIQDLNFKGKTIIHTTTMGTKGLVNANGADEIITGSFVNADAIINYIKTQNPAHVSLVCTGTPHQHIFDEDELCAEYFKNALLGISNDFKRIVKHLKAEGFADHFFSPEITTHPAQDFTLCLDLDTFNFVLKTSPEQGGLVCLKKHLGNHNLSD